MTLFSVVFRSSDTFHGFLNTILVKNGHKVSMFDRYFDIHSMFTVMHRYNTLARVRKLMYWHAHLALAHTQVPKQVDCNICRFSKLLLFSFFFCKDGSDRLMKRASYSCCNFLCIVLAAAYLKYRLCRLSCLPFVWHPFFSL